MYGAMIGDIVGSRYEFERIKTKEFPLFSEGCSFTDDTVMTVAVAMALQKAQGKEDVLRTALVEEMQALGRQYPFPQGGYGARFSAWLRQKTPKPYHSYGNGAAMRVSSCGYLAKSLEETLRLAKCTAEVTHDHPEGIKGAQATAAAIFLARMGATKEEIRAYTCEHFYPLDQTLAEIRPSYGFDESCQGTVPQAIEAFLESTDVEDAMRNAISLGGDSDTLGAIAGSIAWAYYGCCGLTHAMETLKSQAAVYLPKEFMDVADAVENVASQATK